MRRNTPLTIEEAVWGAQARGGQCLSDTLIDGRRSKLRWVCEKGHEWTAAFSNIRAGRWCPTCGGTKRRTLESMRELAATFQGRCLSDSYTPGVKLTWECREGHIFELSAPSVQHDGSWCSICSGYRKHTIEAMHALAMDRGGKCLTPTYSGVHPLLWECRNKHQWEALASNVLGCGSWCPYCAHKVQRRIEEMVAVAAERGGKCLSSACGSVDTKLLWECAKGHTWEAAPHTVLGSPSRRGTWCPLCRAHRSEKECRVVFESMFGAPFPKSRPDWLRNSCGNLMELDGYSEAMKIAFEYQGIQHYQREFLHKPTPNRPPPTVEEFAWQQQKDKEKRTLCWSQGVTLIEVPWYTKDIRSLVQEVRALQ